VGVVAQVKSNEKPIIFTPVDQENVLMPQDNPFVISIVVAKHPIDQIFEDSVSSINLIYWNCFKQMGITHDLLKYVFSPLYSFIGEVIFVAGSVQLPITLGVHL